jgi:hypothetical protein
VRTKSKGSETPSSQGSPADSIDQPIGSLSDLVSLRSAIKSIPSSRPGRPVHVSTAIHWATRGCRAPSGSVIKLKTVRLPGCFMTKAAWLEEFLRELTSVATAPKGPAFALPRTSTQRRRDIARADRILDAAGI